VWSSIRRLLIGPDDRRRFLDAYKAAHPRRVPVAHEGPRLRPHTVYLPDLGDETRNRDLDRMVGEFIQRLTRLIGDA